jgi:type IV secretion system protein VirD4
LPDSIFPPRGSAAVAARARASGLPSASWSDPATLPAGDWTYEPGRVFVGLWGRRIYGIGDPRHVVMIAGSRAGKTLTVLAPNLRQYPGPCIIIDPKGELVEKTAKARGWKPDGPGKDQESDPVRILDPFGVTGRATHTHNPLQELRLSRNIAADAAQLADALIVEAEGSRDTHWTDSARNLITGFILYLLHTEAETASIERLRRLLSAPAPVMHRTFEAMAACTDYPDGTMANAGAAFASMVEFNPAGDAVGFTREMSSILSTARQQTAPLDQVRNVLSGKSSFCLDDIGRKNLTVYLVLPASRIGTHYRWLRMFIMQAFAAVERKPIDVRGGKRPIWFVLEEFAALGHIRAIETAAGYLAGAGIKLWVILQDLTQLRRHYRESWETFLGNAGITMAFGNVDATTTQYLSRLLGDTTVEDAQRQQTTPGQRDAGDLGMRTSQVRVPLLTPDEIALHFSWQTHRALVYVPGYRPTYLERYPFPEEEPKA